MTVQRNLILGLLVALAAIAWGLLLWQAARMDMAAMGPTMGLTAPLFLLIWVAMMVAMMFPTAAPMILLFHRIQATKRIRGEAFVGTWVFVAAYLAVWSAAGVIAYGGAFAAEAIAGAAGLDAPASARIGGALIVLAGLYQLTPIKNICLAHCRTPTAFIMTSWRDGVTGAARMGLEHGFYCLGCCWLLFVILFPLGIMNIAAMAVLTLVIFAEKTFPLGRQIARAVAAALIVYGVIVLAIPAALPSFMPAGEDSGGMPMPDGTIMKMPEAPMKGM